jgi:acetolactate synthase regulatory subunit
MPTGLEGFVFVGARMESYVMTVRCRPRLSTLARIVSVLHARAAGVTALRFEQAQGHGEVVIEVAGPQADRLAEQLRRLVDVT